MTTEISVKFFLEMVNKRNVLKLLTCTIKCMNSKTDFSKVQTTILIIKVYFLQKFWIQFWY